LGVDVDIVKQDQLVASTIGMHDPVLVHSTCNCMHDHRCKGNVCSGSLKIVDRSTYLSEINFHQAVDEVLPPCGLEIVDVGPSDLQEATNLVRVATRP